MRRLALPIAAALLLILPVSAGAHAALVATSPRADAIVPTAPAQVTLTFNESLSDVGAQVQVIGSDGTRYDAGSASVRGRTVTARVANGLPRGTSTVAWSVISDDGHRISDAFSFAVGERSTVPAGAGVIGVAPPPQAATAMALSRALRFAGILLLLGLLAVVALVWNPTLRRGRERDPETAAAADGAFRPIVRHVALIAPPALAAIALIGIPVEAWANGIAFGDELGLRQGQVALAQAALALLAWPLVVRAVRGASRRLQLLAAVPVVALALTPGLSGHANAQESVIAATLVDWAHVLAAGAWGGGVMVLALVAPSVLRATDAQRRAPLIQGIVHRFTRVALAALVILVFSGAIAALELSGGLAEIPQTTWGRVLIAKVVIVLLAIGAARSVRRAGSSFARGVQLEAALIVVAIALTGTLTGLAPRPPTADTAIVLPFRLEQRIEARIAEITIDPGRAEQDNEVHVIVTNGVGQPALDVKDATATLTSATVRSLPVPLTAVSTAHWSGTVRIPAAGRWKVVVRLRIGEFREETLTGTLTAP